jgi:hypothetical protein
MALVKLDFPTPLGPSIKKDASGRFGAWRPARDNRIALATAEIASS